MAAILCADWSKSPKGRAVYAAHVAERSVKRVVRPNWSVSEVLGCARELANDGPVLATFDTPLGVPNGYLAAAAREPSLGSPSTFLELLRRASSTQDFFDCTSSAADWKVTQPFFAVPPGRGGLSSYIQAAKQPGVDLWRDIDRRTGAKPLFAASGMPGAVGGAASSLWSELAPCLTRDRDFAVWPFEGDDLGTLFNDWPIVVGEIYPRVACSTALLDGPTTSLRAPLGN